MTERGGSAGRGATGFGDNASEVFQSPLSLLLGTVLYEFVLFLVATGGFTLHGWPIGDAAYMVLLTVFSVGFGEVHPIDTPFLRLWTTGTIVLGCTGMIVLTGALVQVFSLYQFRRLLGVDRMQSDIARLSDHAIVCGYGRIGVQLAKALSDARHPFVVLERDAAKAGEATAHGHLVLVGEATDEDVLKQSGIDRARVLACVLPNDAANVFITLSARNLNPAIEIIARGEAPSTESKLFHAGANRVVMPTHIGAERITELILYPATESRLSEPGEAGEIKRQLHELGLELEAVTVPPRGALTGESVGEAERRGQGAFFVVQIDRSSGQQIRHPNEDVRIEAGDTVLLVVRGTRLAGGALFTNPARPVRQGRSVIRHR